MKATDFGGSIPRLGTNESTKYVTLTAEAENKFHWWDVFIHEPPTETFHIYFT